MIQMGDIVNPYVYITTIIEYFTFIILSIINRTLYQKYKERNSNITKLLLYAMFYFSLSPVLQSQDIFYGNALTFQYWGYEANFGYSFAILMAAIANYYISDFTNNVFNREPKWKNNIVAIISLIVAIIFIIFESIRYLQIIATGILGIYILLSFIIYFNLAIKCFKNASKVSGKMDKRGYQYIAFMGILLILMYIFLVVEMEFFHIYSIFGSIAWIMGLCGAISAYVGYCRPSWFQRLYKDN
jgi:hypothetical protein